MLAFLLLTSLAAARPHSVVSTDAHGGATRLEVNPTGREIHLKLSSTQSSCSFILTPAEWKKLTRAHQEHARSDKEGHLVIASGQSQRLSFHWAPPLLPTTARFLQADRPAGTTQVQFFYTLEPTTLKQFERLLSDVSSEIK